MPLKDLVVYLWNRQVTGTLSLEKEGVKKSVSVESGYVINASSNLPREYLGQFLINLGHITEEQFNRAFETQRETKVFMGRILVMIGLVTEDIISAVLLMKFRETLLEAFDWTAGTFVFDPDKRPQETDGLDTRMPLIEIHKESDFRAQAWERIRIAFPSGSCTLQLRSENLEGAPKQGSIDEKIIQGIEAGQTLDELALKLHATDYFLYQRLYALHRLGAIVVKPPRPEPGPRLEIDVDLGLGDSPTAEQLLANARQFFEQSNFRDAWALARRSQTMTATLDATLLLKQIENAWVPQLRADLLGKRRVPAVSIPDATLKALPLSAPERYLISRVDGKRELDAIVRVAPLREFETLTFIDRFVSQSWVTLR